MYVMVVQALQGSGYGDIAHRRGQHFGGANLQQFSVQI